MSALPPDLREAVETVRGAFVRGRGVEKHDAGRAALALIDQRLMEYERVVEAARQLLIDTDSDPDCRSFPMRAWIDLVEANHALDSPKEKP